MEDVQLLTLVVVENPLEGTIQMALTGVDDKKAKAEAKRIAAEALLQQSRAFVEKSVRARSNLRKAVTNHATVPVVVVAGRLAPKLLGHSSYYATASGVAIRFPNAYRRTYRHPIYHPSTIRVEVGAAWVVKRMDKLGRKSS